MIYVYIYFIGLVILSFLAGLCETDNHDKEAIWGGIIVWPIAALLLFVIGIDALGERFRRK